MIEPDGIDDSFNHAIQVGIIKDDEGRFATQFKRELFAGTSGSTANTAAYVSGTSKGNLVYTAMTNQCLPNLGGLTRQNVDDASREPDLLHDLGKFERGQRGVTRGFEYDRIAHSQGRCDLPGHHEQGKIPGDDLSYNPDRFITR